MATKKGKFNSLLANKTFIFFTVFVTILATLLIAFFVGAFDFLKTDNKDSSEKSQDYGEHSDLAQNLLESRWVGELTVNSNLPYDEDPAKINNGYQVELDIEFFEKEGQNDFYSLDFIGNAQIIYDTPVFSGGKTVYAMDFDLAKSGAVAEIKGEIHYLNRPERDNKTALLKLSDESVKKLGASGTATSHMLIGTPGGPKTDYKDKYSFSPQDICTGALDICVLSQLQWLAVMPESEDKLILSQDSHLNAPAPFGSTVIGYLEKVSVRELSEPLKEGQKVETSAKEALKARIKSRALESSSPKSEADLLISPNTSMEVKEVDEKSLLELFYGKMRLKLKNLPADYDFKVLFLGISAAVRGTDFSVNALDDDTAIIMVYEGEVGVKLNETGKEITLKKGQYLISSDKDPKAHNSNIKDTPSWW